MWVCAGRARAARRAGLGAGAAPARALLLLLLLLLMMMMMALVMQPARPQPAACSPARSRCRSRSRRCPPRCPAEWLGPAHLSVHILGDVLRGGGDESGGGGSGGPHTPGESAPSAATVRRAGEGDARMVGALPLNYGGGGGGGSGMQYKVGGCDVYWPHAGGAYGVQLSFMAKVISALTAGNNALLEAPTGERVGVSCGEVGGRVGGEGRAAGARRVRLRMHACTHTRASTPPLDCLQAAARRCRCCAPRCRGRSVLLLLLACMRRCVAGRWCLHASARSPPPPSHTRSPPASPPPPGT